MKNTILLISAATLAAIALSQTPTWNYDNHGTDWTVGQCASKSQPQAPLNWNYQKNNMTQADWSIYNFAFLPNYRSVKPTKSYTSNYTYIVEGNFGGTYASDIYGVFKEVFYNSYAIRFKVPGEHQIFNQTYDLEMQVLHYDYFGRAFFCKAGRIAAFSLLFKNTGTTNDFFDWIDDPTNKEVDLSKLLTGDIAMH